MYKCAFIAEIFILILLVNVATATCFVTDVGSNICLDRCIVYTVWIRTDSTTLWLFVVLFTSFYARKYICLGGIFRVQSLENIALWIHVNYGCYYFTRTSYFYCFLRQTAAPVTVVGGLSPVLVCRYTKTNGTLTLKSSKQYYLRRTFFIKEINVAVFLRSISCFCSGTSQKRSLINRRQTPVPRGLPEVFEIAGVAKGKPSGVCFVTRPNCFFRPYRMKYFNSVVFWQGSKRPAYMLTFSWVGAILHLPHPRETLSRPPQWPIPVEVDVSGHGRAIYKRTGPPRVEQRAWLRGEHTEFHVCNGTIVVILYTGVLLAHAKRSITSLSFSVIRLSPTTFSPPLQAQYMPMPPRYTSAVIPPSSSIPRKMQEVR